MSAWRISGRTSGRISGWISWRSRLHIAIALAAALALFAWQGPALAEPLRGAALIVGNGRYAHIAELPNPVDDARAMSDLVDGLGFDATDRTNRGAAEMKRDIDRFVEDAEGADVAFFYYGGHAIEADGENWLVPVDADLRSLETARDTLIPLSSIVERLQAKAKVVIVLLDACRNNPFPAGAMLRADAGAAPVAIAAAGLGEPRGGSPFVSVGGSTENLATVIGFAAERGKVALDGRRGAHSPYAAALLKHLAASGASFADVMTMVTEEVYLATGTRQRPWVNASLRRVLYFGASEAQGDADEALLRDARRGLLMTIAATPAETRGFVEQLAAREKLPLDQLYGMLTMLKVDVTAGPEALEKQLTAGAENLRRIMAGRVVPLRDDPELARLSDLADRAEAEGAIALAQTFRARASARADELRAGARQRLEDAKADQLQIAATYAAEAETAYLASDRATAVKRYHDAFIAATGVNDRLALGYRIGEATALADFIIDDHPWFEKAVAAAENALAIARRIGDPVAEADAFTALGSVWDNAAVFHALEDDGDEKSDAAEERAEATYRQALTEELKRAAPLRWAALQQQLADFLAPGGMGVFELEDTEAALAALDAALGVVPADLPAWVDLQARRAHLLRDLGDFHDDPDFYRKAAAAYRAALSGNRDGADQVIAAQNGLAEVLERLSATQNDIALLREAVEARREMLASTPEDDASWLGRMTMLADSLLTLGMEERGTDALNQAVTLYLTAMGRIGAQDDQGLKADIQSSLGATFDMLARRQHSAAYYAGAVTAYRAALVPGLREAWPERWALLQSSLGGVLGDLAFLQHGKDPGPLLEEAEAAYGAALTLHTREDSPELWASTASGLAYLTVKQAEYTGDNSRLAEAVSTLREAHAILAAADSPDTPYVADSLCRALLDDGIARGDRAVVDEARRLCKDATAQFAAANEAWALAEAEETLARVEKALASMQ